MDIQSGKTSPAALLRDGAEGGVYIVPAFQRSYEWATAQWDDLWSDISSLVHSSGEHFMGPLVLTSKFEQDAPPPEPYRSLRFRYVIDGQQRLVTMSILFAHLSRALTDLAGAPGWDSDIDTSLRVDATRSYKLLDSKLQIKPPRILLNEELPRAALAKALDADQIYDRGLPEGTAEAASAIAACSEFFAARLAEQVHGLAPADQLARIRELTKAVRDRLEFIEINLNSDEDAYTIFESFNAKGRELSRADLVKNFLMGQAHRLSSAVGSRDLERRVADYWAEMTKDVEAGSQPLPVFLRHYWIAKDGKSAQDLVRMDTLYPRVRSHIKSLVDAADAIGSSTRLKDFGEELEEAASKYVWLWGPAGQPDPFDQVSKGLIQRCRVYLDGIRVFGSAQALPVLLAALLTDVPPDDFERLCSALEKMAVTRSLARLPPNEVEKRTKAWCEVLRGDADKTTQVTRVIHEVAQLAEEAAARDPFRSGRFTASQAKHVLLRIENYMREGRPTERLTMSTVDLEHIYPQNPKLTDWPGWSGEPGIGSRLGNLTLLGPKANRKIKNGRYSCGSASPSFGKATRGLPAPISCCKRHLYEASTVLLTNALTKSPYEYWSPRAISLRERELALDAEKTWPLANYPVTVSA